MSTGKTFETPLREIYFKEFIYDTVGRLAITCCLRITRINIVFQDLKSDWLYVFLSSSSTVVNLN